jgi:hypothetical protein
MATELKSQAPSDLQGVFRIYNQYVIDMVMELKRLAPPHDDIRDILRRNGHRKIDVSSDAHLLHGSQTLPTCQLQASCLSKSDFYVDPDNVGDYIEAMFEDTAIAPFEPLAGLAMRKIAALLRSAQGDDDYREGIMNVLFYVHVLMAFCVAHNIESAAAPEGGGDGALDVKLSSTVISIISKMQSGDSEGGQQQGVNELIDSIIDDDLTILIARIGQIVAVIGGNASSEDDAECDDDNDEDIDMMSMLNGSKIASLAKEVASDINVGDIIAENEKLDVSKLLSDGKLIGDIIGKVGSKIHGKMASGELNQKDLVKEAMKIMGSFNGGARGGIVPGRRAKKRSGGGLDPNMGDMFAEIMKNVSSSFK